jgi:hypothetical protein
MTDIRFRKLSALQKEIARSSIEFFIKKIMPRMRNLSITVVGIEGGTLHGDCDFLDPENKRPKEFLIRVNKSLTIRDFIATIMHEMVHVKQWARREMWDLPSVNALTRSWKGSKINISEVDYWSHPWEIEAYDLQYKLTDEYLNT